MLLIYQILGRIFGALLRNTPPLAIALLTPERLHKYQVE
ncbi:hypothetical protein NSP_4650 [Nodularia spumigena CCY9414]|nr:hypothetical protein NSP_4650 [Nodularia spumigena CCY9414]